MSQILQEETILCVSYSVILKYSVSTSTSERRPNHLPDENKLPQMEKRRRYAQICSTSQANAYQGLPVFNECGTTRQTLDVFDSYKKPFQSWNIFTGCFMRERSAPCNATWCPRQFFNRMGVILCATGQSKTCSLISAKRRGMHPPVNPDLSFFPWLSFYLASCCSAHVWRFLQSDRL